MTSRRRGSTERSCDYAVSTISVFRREDTSRVEPDVGRSCSLPQKERSSAIVLMGHEFFSISVLVTENPTRTGRGSYRRWWLVA